MKKLTTYKNILTFLLQIVVVYRGKMRAAVRKQHRDRTKWLGAACLAGVRGLIVADVWIPGAPTVLRYRQSHCSIVIEH